MVCLLKHSNNNNYNLKVNRSSIKATYSSNFKVVKAGQSDNQDDFYALTCNKSQFSKPYNVYIWHSGKFSDFTLVSQPSTIKINMPSL